MSKLTLTGLALPLFLLFASPPASAPKAFGATKETPESQGQTGTLQRMIVESGSVTMDLDLNQLNGIGSGPGRPTTLQFAVAHRQIGIFARWEFLDYELLERRA